MWDGFLIALGMVLAFFIQGWNNYFRKKAHFCPKCSYQFKPNKDTQV